jgi:Fic family protein
MPPVPYHQGKFPPTELNWARLIPLIGPAAAAVSRYEGVLSAVPNAHVLLSPLTTREAVLSSRIEGTQTTFGEVLHFEATDEEPAAGRGADITEVLNYRRALLIAVEEMGRLPLSLRLLRSAHARLLEGARGGQRDPGRFRRVPVWIGPSGTGQEEARYTPPSVELVPGAMDEWERYLHSEQPDKLTQLAILHAEFEAIHPFLDGNGRIGRLLVPLFMVHAGLLATPSFYISAYLEAHRDEYYERLLAVSRDGDWTGWCEFFLTAVRLQAQANQAKASEILALYEKTKGWILELTHSQHAVPALDWLFMRPVFRVTDFVEHSGVPAATGRRILKLAREGGMLRELRPASGRRPGVLAVTELLDIVDH